MRDLRNTHLVTHKDCLDGAGCAIMFMRAGGKREEISFVTAGRVSEFIESGRLDGKEHVLFADVGLSDPSKLHVFDRLSDCEVLDHHRTSLWMSDIPWCKIDMDACGTELTRRHLELADEASVELARYIDDTDRWVLDLLPQSQDLYEFTTLVGQKEFIDRFIRRERAAGDWFTPDERSMLEAVKRFRDEDMEAIVKRTIVRDAVIEGTMVRCAYVVSSFSNTSKLLMTIIDRNPGVRMAAQVNFDRNQVSLRSHDGYDVSRVAKIFGGGGHLAASAHPFHRGFVKDIVEEIHGA